MESKDEWFSDDDDDDDDERGGGGGGYGGYGGGGMVMLNDGAGAVFGCRHRHTKTAGGSSRRGGRAGEEGRQAEGRGREGREEDRARAGAARRRKGERRGRDPPCHRAALATLNRCSDGGAMGAGTAIPRALLQQLMMQARAEPGEDDDSDDGEDGEQGPPPQCNQQ